MDPAQCWRGLSEPPPRDRFIEAFLAACAIHAGQQERVLMDIVEALGRK